MFREDSWIFVVLFLSYFTKTTVELCRNKFIHFRSEYGIGYQDGEKMTCEPSAEELAKVISVLFILISNVISYFSTWLKNSSLQLSIDEIDITNFSYVADERIA